jgi:hypothetical protein
MTDGRNNYLAHLLETKPMRRPTAGEAPKHRFTKLSFTTAALAELAVSFDINPRPANVNPSASK